MTPSHRAIDLKARRALNLSLISSISLLPFISVSDLLIAVLNCCETQLVETLTETF